MEENNVVSSKTSLKSQSLIKQKDKSKKSLLSRLLHLFICSSKPKISYNHKIDHQNSNPLKFENEITSDFITEKKALYNGRTHFEKVGFYHELPVCVVLHIISYLELDLSKKTIATNNSHVNINYSDSPSILQEIIGIFRPWNIYRMLYQNVSIDITVYNKAQDLRFLAKHVKRLRFVGGVLKSQTIRAIILRSNQESLSMQLSSKGVKRILSTELRMNSESFINSNKKNEDLDLCSECSSSSSNINTDSTIDIFSDFSEKCESQLHLKLFDISNSTIFRQQSPTEENTLFNHFLKSFPYQFKFLTTFIAENCLDLSGSHIRNIISLFSEWNCPIEHFSVSPKKKSSSKIVIEDYLGIENWPLKILKIHITRLSNSESLQDASFHANSHKEIFNRIVYPLKDTLISFSGNLPFFEVRILFDSHQFIKLKTLNLLSLGTVNIDDNFRQILLENNTLRSLNLELDHNTLKEFEILPKLSDLLPISTDEE